MYSPFMNMEVEAYGSFSSYPNPVPQLEDSTGRNIF